MSKVKRVTLDDVALEVGLSRFLVCRALTGKPGINEGTRKRIQEAALRLGYKNQRAKRTAAPEVKSVVLLIDEIEANRVFWTRIIRGIEAAARNYGWDLLLRAISRDEVVKGEIPSVILEGRVNGVLITGNFTSDYVARFEKLDCEVVLVDNYLPTTRHDAVLIADWEGSFLTTKHLLELGHKKIGYAGQISGHWSWIQRYHGFLQALHEYGMDYNSDYSIGQKHSDRIWEDHELINREIINLKNFPTAWVCNNDYTAQVVIKALKKIGKSIPKDLSIVGFDDLVPEDFPENPPLTTVRVFGATMGEAAFEQLLWRLSNRNSQSRCILVGVQFVEGATTAPPEYS